MSTASNFGATKNLLTQSPNSYRVKPFPSGSTLNQPMQISNATYVGGGGGTTVNKMTSPSGYNSHHARRPSSSRGDADSSSYFNQIARGIRFPRNPYEEEKVLRASMPVGNSLNPSLNKDMQNALFLRR